MRARAYRFRAYASKTTARVLETQLEATCKLYNTSRECFLCGRIKGLTLEDRVFRYPHCGFTLDRDLNASLILLKRAGWVPPAAPVELRPIPPLPSMGLGRQGVAAMQEAPAFRRG